MENSFFPYLLKGKWRRVKSRFHEQKSVHIVQKIPYFGFLFGVCVCVGGSVLIINVSHVATQREDPYAVSPHISHQSSVTTHSITPAPSPHEMLSSLYNHLLSPRMLSYAWIQSENKQFGVTVITLATTTITRNFQKINYFLAKWLNL